MGCKRPFPNVRANWTLKNCEKVSKTCLEHVFIMVGNCHIES